jgi:Carboxypeptidase regulatory-like domain
MTHKTIAQVWLGVALAGALVGCPSVGSNPPAPPPPPPPSGSGVVTGFVTDINNGGGISGAKVRALNGNAQTTTDARGAFTLGGLATGSVKLEFTKTGFAPSYDAQTIGTNEASSLVTLKKEGAEQPYNATTTQTLVERTEAGPYAVILSPNSLDTTETNLKVSITPVDPTKEADVEHLSGPRDLRGVQHLGFQRQAPQPQTRLERHRRNADPRADARAVQDR